MLSIPALCDSSIRSFEGGDDVAIELFDTYKAVSLLVVTLWVVVMQLWC